MNRSLYCIKQTKNNLSLHALKSLYFAPIHLHLTYCPIILSCTNKTNINRICKVQKKTIRVITHSCYHDHTALQFKNLEILPFNKMIEQSNLIFMHSIEFNYAPRAFANSWIKHNEGNTGHELEYPNTLPNVERTFTLLNYLLI
jgi:hypothetical protein